MRIYAQRKQIALDKRHNTDIYGRDAWRDQQKIHSASTQRPIPVAYCRLNSILYESIRNEIRLNAFTHSLTLNEVQDREENRTSFGRLPQEKKKKISLARTYNTKRFDNLYGVPCGG